MENFPVSGQTLPPELTRAYGFVRWAAADANERLGVLSSDLADLIRTAAEEVTQGKRDHEFVFDIFQTGSGTSTNMNVNEVIANRCSQLTGEPDGSKKPVHPNDHVNCSQSSNDTFPTAFHVSVALRLKEDLIPSREGLYASLRERAEAFEESVRAIFEERKILPEAELNEALDPGGMV